MVASFQLTDRRSSSLEATHRIGIAGTMVRHEENHAAGEMCPANDHSDESLEALEIRLAAAVSDGQRGETFLIEAFKASPSGDRGAVIAALGEATGNDGGPALRALIANNDESSDDRCAGLVALAKREGAAASDFLLGYLDDTDEDIRLYALACLAYVGDNRAWDTVHGRLQELLEQSAPRVPNAMGSSTLSIQSANLMPIGYLARHSHSVEPSREAAVVRLIRSKWHKLYTAEKDWLKEYWPACAEDRALSDEGRPDAPRVTEWLRKPLFSPLYSDRTKL